MIETIKNGQNKIQNISGYQPGFDLREETYIIRKAMARVAIIRKLKDLGLSDEAIYLVYNKSQKEN